MRHELAATTVQYDRNTGVGHLTMNRPEALNAFNTQLREDIVEGLRLLEDETAEDGRRALRAVIIEGADETFSVGADVSESSQRERLASSERPHYDFIDDYPVPTIAKIRGYCLGGGLETAMFCDVRFAHEDSQFGLPEVNLGIIPGAGGIQFLSRYATPAVAKELALEGEHFDAKRANDLGLVNRVYGDDLDEQTRTFAETVAAKPPLAVQGILDAGDISTQTSLKEGIAHDMRLVETLFTSEDAEKAMRAFGDDEYEPEFTGR
ncbi:enoyl-CoA hydratase/isomerase family protein [Halobacteriales archaeon Cl-PHB]